MRLSWFGYTLFFALLLLAGCRKEYSYESNRSAGFLIRDAANNCRGITVLGSYQVNRQPGSGAGLEVIVQVTRPGLYSISSNQVNGISFQASGTFTDTGTTRVRLAVSGKPGTSGHCSFLIQYDSSQCEALLEVTDTLTNVVLTTNPDYFPIATNNRWVYDDLSFPGDSVLMEMTGDTLQAASLHKIQDQFITFYPVTNQAYFRRSGNNYYSYIAVSTFTSALDYAPSIYDDVNFLQEKLQTGDSWYSSAYTGRTSLGLQTLSLRYHFKCIDADGTVVLNGRTFIHVYKIQMIPEVSDPGQPLAETGEIHTYYYAKGIGLIYAEFFNGIKTHPELQIRSWSIQ